MADAGSEEEGSLAAQPAVVSELAALRMEVRELRQLLLAALARQDGG